MAITLGLSIASLKAERRLGLQGADLAKSFERLSSGQRINRASDDPAGLSVSSILNADSRIFSQAIRNVNDGISALNVAEGALQQLTGITTRQIELAEQAANGVYSLAQRRALDKEANALVDEFNRITQSTTFNGLNLLNTSVTNVAVQAGKGTASVISAAITQELDRNVGVGTFGTSAQYVIPGALDAMTIEVADMNKDGILDALISNDSTNLIQVSFGASSGTFSASFSRNIGTNTMQVSSQDLNGDGNLDLLVLGQNNTLISIIGNGDGTFAANRTFTLTSSNMMTSGDFDGDGNIDVVTGGSYIELLRGNGDGTFRAKITYAATGSVSAMVAGDTNGDGRKDLIYADSASNVRVMLGTSSGTLATSIASSNGGVSASYIDAADLNHDGNLDVVTATAGSRLSVLLGNGDGSFGTAVSYTASNGYVGIKLGDFNGDGIPDALTSAGIYASLLIGNANGTFSAAVSLAIGGSGLLAIGDHTGDGALDVYVVDMTANSIYTSRQNTTTSSTVAQEYLLTKEGARSALVTFQATLERITREAGKIGANQSRLETAVNNLQSTTTNIQAAYGRITDADVAEESATLISRQILQQAASAVLTQANVESRVVLSLLGG